MVRLLALSLACVLLAAACRTAPEADAPIERETAAAPAAAPARLREHDGALELALAVTADGAPRPWSRPVEPAERELALDALPGGALPLGVRLAGEHVVCTRAVDGPPIPYLVLERRGERHGYGVYGLGGPKNGLPVPRPLSPESVTWDERDAAAAVRYLLERAGLEPAAAAALLAAREADWLGEGLRVLFFLRTADARTVLPPEVATGGRPLVLRVAVDGAEVGSRP